MSTRGATFAALAARLGVGLRTAKRWGATRVPVDREADVRAVLAIPDEPAPVSVAAAALDRKVGALLDEHGPRDVIGSVARMMRS